MRHIIIRIEELEIKDDEEIHNGLLAVSFNALNVKHALRMCIRMIGDDSFAYTTKNKADEEIAERLLDSAPIKSKKRTKNG